jgi:amidase
MDHLERLDATAQASLVRSGEVSPEELVETAILRIEKLNPGINAVIIEWFDQARETSRGALPDGPFRGVPFLVKDLWGGDLAGAPRYAGSQVLRDAGARVAADDVLAVRFRDAGLVRLGKTNTPEFGIQPTTQPLAFGATRNPWDLQRSTGGSSGGSAAAVASGMVPIAHGSDSAGSLRIPASFCGVVGLKPSRGRISYGADFVGATSAAFVLTRSVRDAAGILDAVRGSHPADLFRTAQPDRPFTDGLVRPPQRLRMGLLLDPPRCHPDCSVGVRATGEALVELGHEVEVSLPPALFEEEIFPHTAPMVGAMVRRSFLREVVEFLGRPITAEDVEPLTWALEQAIGTSSSAVDLLDALAWCQRFGWRIAEWFDAGHDPVAEFGEVPCRSS